MQAWNAHFTYGNYFVDRIKTESILLCKTAAKYVAASILNAEEVGNALRSERGGRFADIDEVLPADEIPDDLELPEEEPTLDEWGESKHPRKDNGQFGTGSGGKETKEGKQTIKTNVWKDETKKKEAEALLEKEDSQKNIDDVPSVSYREVGEKEADRLNSAIGLDLTGFVHQLTAGGIRHIFKSHGDEQTEKARGQLPITKEDILLIPLITGDFDNVALAKEKSEGRNILIYSKKIGNMYFYYESVGGRKNKTLQPKTMYKRKAKWTNLMTGIQSPLSLTPEAIHFAYKQYISKREIFQVIMKKKSNFILGKPHSVKTGIFTINTI